MEKSVTTPDQYPLTLNALVNACNQKSSRNPVMSLTQGTVQHTVRGLEVKNLLLVEENFKRGVEKYKQRFCNTSFSDLQFDSAQFAIVCLLLLRGPQTPGELRAHSGRLHDFVDNAVVIDALNGLLEREGGALVIMLPRTPGRKESEYMHLFSGPVDINAYTSSIESTIATDTSGRLTVAELTARVLELEAEVAEIKTFLKLS
jgi:uncharacterized protein YceH (UPF0502 family)